MKNQINPSAKRTLLFLIIFLIAVFAFCSMLTSCEATRKVYKDKTDSTHVAAKDSGGVKLSTSSTKNANDWWKETIVYPQSKDTTINNFYNTTTPAIIYREGGSQKQETNKLDLDSFWKKQYDSMKVVNTSKTVESKVQVLSFWQIVGIGLACSLVVGIALIIISKFKISLR